MDRNVQETIDTMKHTKNNKAASPGGIPMELNKKN